MPSVPERFIRQHYGIVRIAAGAFEDLAALDMPRTCAALADLRAAHARVDAAAARLREEAFARIRGCEDARMRRELLRRKRDLFNGRRVRVDDAEYNAAIADADAAHEQFLRAFEAESAAARERLHALASSESFQHPLALSSLTLLAKIQRRITPHTERALMKYAGRMHAKTSPFSTFCHVAVATFGPPAVRLGEPRIHVRANRLAATKRIRAEEAYFEDSIVDGEVVCDADAIDDTIRGYARDLAFTDRSLAIRRQLRCAFDRQYGRDAVVPLSHFRCEIEPVEDPAIRRWTRALGTQLTANDGVVHIERQHVDHAFAAVPELRRELPGSVCAMLQFSSQGAVLNNFGSGYGRFTSRFLDLLPPAVLEEQRAIIRASANGSRLVEVRDGSLTNMNLHPPLADGEIGEDDALFVKIGNDDTLWLLDDRGARIEVLNVDLQEPAERSPFHRFLNAAFARADELVRKPMVNAALAAFRNDIARPRVVYDRRLILRRKAWVIPRDLLPFRASAESDAAYFARVDAWRERLAIPRYVFARIRKPQRRDDRKPLFLSFASWHSVALFESLLRRVTTQLTLQEMLPSPDDMLEWNGRRHAAEFVVQWNRSA